MKYPFKMSHIQYKYQTRHDFFNLQNSNIKHKWKCSNMMENKNYFSARSPF